MSILASFPYPNPRSEQVEVLQSIEKQIDSADVFVIKVPTAGGKTGLAMTIMRWLLKSENLKTCYAVPNNILLQQFEDAFPKMHLMKNMDSYECILYKGDSCRDIRGKKDCITPCLTSQATSIRFSQTSFSRMRSSMMRLIS